MVVNSYIGGRTEDSFAQNVLKCSPLTGRRVPGHPRFKSEQQDSLPLLRCLGTRAVACRVWYVLSARVEYYRDLSDELMAKPQGHCNPIGSDSSVASNALPHDLGERRAAVDESGTLGQRPSHKWRG